MERTPRIRTKDGKINLVGKQISELRIKLGMSQSMLALELQLQGVSLHKNAVSAIEQGRRSVSDIELIAFAAALHASVAELYRVDGEIEPAAIIKKHVVL